MLASANLREERMSGSALPAPRRAREWIVWFVLVALVMPVLTAGVVAGYGFVVWMSQQILGPPGQQS
jgi:nitrate reductase NapE